MNANRTSAKMTHEEMIKKMLADPVVYAEYERLEHGEFSLLDAMLNARGEAGLTQSQVAERMGTKVAAIARLESALASGTGSPSINTLHKYAAAVGKKLEVNFV